MRSSENFSKLYSLSVHMKKCLSKPGFYIMHLWKLRFNVVQKNTSKRRGELRSNSCSWYLFIKFRIELKKITLKNEVRHFTYIFCRYIFIKITFILFFKDVQTFTMWNIVAFCRLNWLLVCVQTFFAEKKDNEVNSQRLRGQLRVFSVFL